MRSLNSNSNVNQWLVLQRLLFRNDISITQLPRVNIFSSVWRLTHFCTCFSVSSFMLLIFYMWSIIRRKMPYASLFCFQRLDSVVLMMTSPSLCSHIVAIGGFAFNRLSSIHVYFVLVSLSQLCLPTSLGEAILYWILIPCSMAFLVSRNCNHYQGFQ